MLGNLFGGGIWFLLFIPLRLIALVVHEYSHGFVSAKLGDPTPRIRGRLTLNPLAHLDPMGTILMLLTGFGWARPVEVNPMYYKDRKKGMGLVAFAGPLSNFILAFVSLLLYGILYVILYKLGVSYTVIDFFGQLCVYSAQINLCFMVFNLIPIPPLDGSRILGMFISDRAYYSMLQYERYSMFLIMALSLSGALSGIIGRGIMILYIPMVNLVNFLINLII